MDRSVAVELGASVVRAICVERRAGQLWLAASAHVPWSGSAGEELRAALAELRKLLPIRRPVVLGIPTTSAIVASVRPLVVHPSRARLAVQFELQQQLPYEVAQAVWHYQWRQETAASQALVAATKRTVLDDYVQSCRRAGVAIHSVSVSILGAVNAWYQQLTRSDPPTGILLRVDPPAMEWIFIGPSGLHVVPFRVPAETDGLTGASQTGTKQPWRDEALIEILKGSWESVRDFSEASKTPPVGIGTGSATAQQAGISAASGSARAAVAVESRPRIWLLGASGAGLTATLKQELSCDVTPLQISQIVRPGKADTLASETFAAAAGLALQGLNAARLPLNLLVEIQAQRRVKTTRRLARLTAAVGMSISLACAGHGMLAVLRRRQALLSSLAEQEKMYQKLRPEARTVLHRQARLENRLHQLQELLLSRTLTIHAFERATEVMPDEVWLTRSEFSKNGGLHGLLEGRSRSFPGVTQLMNQLKTSVGWSTVKLLGTTVKSDPGSNTEVVAFTIEMQQPLSTTAGQQAASKSLADREEPSR